MRQAARIGLCAIEIALAMAAFAALPGGAAQNANTAQKADAVASTGKRNPSFLRYGDLKAWYGLRVRAVLFEGVTEQDLGGVAGKLALQPGNQLTPQNVKESLHALYAAGLYRSIVAEGVETGGQVTVTFPVFRNYFCGDFMSRV